MTDGIEKLRALGETMEPVDMPKELADEPVPGMDDEPEAQDDDHGGPDGHDAADFGDSGMPPPGDSSDIPPEKLAKGATFYRNDVGNAERMVLYFGDQVMFVPDVGWHVWDGLRWAYDHKGIAVSKLAQRLCRIIWDEAATITLSDWQMDKIALLDGLEETIARLERKEKRDKANFTESDRDDLDAARVEFRMCDEYRATLSGLRSAHRKFALTSGNMPKIKGACDLTATRRVHDVDELDRDDMALNTLSGTLVFKVDPGGDGASKTAGVELRPHDRADLMTKIVPADYDPAAKAPEWEGFLERMQPDAAQRRLLKRYYGLCLTGIIEKVLLWSYGHGDNGKTVSNEIVARVMGDYAGSMDIKSLTGEDKRDASNATPDLILMIGRRFIRMAEPEKGAHLQESKIKKITGGDPMQVRQLNEGMIEIQPKCKIAVSGNHKPVIKGNDDAIWNRFLLITWPVTIAKEEIDLGLVARIVEKESAGVLAWLVEGCLEYLESGLAIPAHVRAENEAFRIESDEVLEFLIECTDVTGDDADFIPVSDLTEAVRFFQSDRNRTPWSARSVQNNLAQQKAVTFKHPRTGKTFRQGKRGDRGYLGIRFTPEFAKLFEARESKGKSWRGGSSSAEGGI